MVKSLSIGLLGIQGAIAEHLVLLNNVFQITNTTGKVTLVYQKKDISQIDALILPGGESTTISKILKTSGLYTAIQQRVQDNDLPIMGTCAGCVLLAKETTDNYDDLQPLQIMNMEVERNAFGRQRESFETDLSIKGFKTPYHAVFIRAPLIRKIWGTCKTLATIDNKMIVAAQQDNFLALSFHPELTNDLRIHSYFLDMI